MSWETSQELDRLGEMLGRSFNDPELPPRIYCQPRDVDPHEEDQGTEVTGEFVRAWENGAWTHTARHDVAVTHLATSVGWLAAGPGRPGRPDIVRKGATLRVRFET